MPASLRSGDGQCSSPLSSAPSSQIQVVDEPQAARPARKTQADRKWQTHNVLTNPKSPIADADLRAILCHPSAWSVLTKPEQREILALFPDGQHILDAGTPAARPDIDSLRNDNTFRHDCARYAEDIKNGFHDEDWLRDAWVAHEQRKAGYFDEFEAQKFEEDWGVELPEEWKPEAMRKGRKEARGGANGDGDGEGLEVEVEVKTDKDEEEASEEVKASQGVDEKQEVKVAEGDGA